jgi:hypothetical protein
MGRIIHYDRIAEKLEMARTIGLVNSYSVLSAGPECDASVTVWRAGGASDSTIKDYLIGLLEGLVAVEQILVLAPGQVGETATAVSGEEPLRDAVPVAA